MLEKSLQDLLIYFLLYPIVNNDTRNIDMFEYSDQLD